MNARKWKEIEIASWEMEHEIKCQWNQSSTPMNECTCDCYEKWWFNKGVQYATETQKD